MLAIMQIKIINLPEIIKDSRTELQSIIIIFQWFRHLCPQNEFYCFLSLYNYWIFISSFRFIIYISTVLHIFCFPGGIGVHFYWYVVHFESWTRALQLNNVDKMSPPFHTPRCDILIFPITSHELFYCGDNRVNNVENLSRSWSVSTWLDASSLLLWKITIFKRLTVL